MENEKFSFDNENTLSPKSETDKVLFIDESVDHSIQTLLSDDILEKDTKHIVEGNSENNDKLDKKAQKQQCFTCGKVMSSS